MEAIQSRVESWIKDQTSKIMKVSWGPLQWRMRWPWPSWINNDRERRKLLQSEYERRRKQLQDLCLALKAESIADLQDILCCMVLSECVYKRPATEMIRAVNKFKADFGGEVVSLERVQPSGDHVPHRYLLAEAGDTLFASFIGTKQYKDIMADANIMQGAVFLEDAVEDAIQPEGTESGQVENQSSKRKTRSKAKQLKGQLKPAAHRGFMARAKGIPALELYRLAQKKNRRLVLCGHSLGGAVAALATLAILRVFAASSVKDNEKVHLKCITFSQPPVGNAALKNYVNQKGWQHYFKSYCIPEDLVPRILSPAYFHHYNDQPSSMNTEVETVKQSVLESKEALEKTTHKLKENGGEQLVFGLGPVQKSMWRLARLVPLEGFRTQLNKYRRKQVEPVNKLSATESSITSSVEDVVAESQSVEIQEGSDGISLRVLADSNDAQSDEAVGGKLREKANSKTGDGKKWRQVPYLPSYVPFGQLFLLGTSSVELLSGAEYSKLTTVGSVITEVRERFQSHSMKSYRSRFQRIYEMCMADGPSSELPNVQQWFGLAIAGAVELTHIVESPVIRTATSIAPLGWSGVPGEKNAEPLKVDITGYRLHLCSLFHAQVNGKWYSTTVESIPSTSSNITNGTLQPELQRIRVLVGAPLRQPPKSQIVTDSLNSSFPSIASDDVDLSGEHSTEHKNKLHRPEGLSDLHIYCTSDFDMVSKEVHLRTRRVRLLGLEGAGKTSLFKAITAQGKVTTNLDISQMETDYQEGIAGGVCYCDSAGVNLPELKLEVSRFRDELWTGIHDLYKKTDLIILVHNLSHKIPQYNSSGLPQQYPVLSLLLDEAKALGIPWILAITNKFSVSAHQQKAAVDAVLHAYKASSSTTAVINSCPYIMPTAAASASLSWAAATGDSDGRTGAQKLIFAPINLVRRPFQKRDIIFTVEGVNSLCKLVHGLLRSNEEASFQELVTERLSIELAREAELAKATSNLQTKQSPMNSAAVGASLGAGLGIVLAVVMGAASALRKP